MLIDHFEDHLGEIDAGWLSDCGRFQVVLFPEAVNGVDAYATLGVSRYPLCEEIRQEFVLLAPVSMRDKNLPGVLMQVASEALDSGHAFARGDIVRRHGQVVDGSPFRALYLTLPAYLPESFATAEDGAGNKVSILWVVPVTPEEERIVQDGGWSYFEDLLEQQDPDLTDFSREAVRLQAKTI